MARKYLPGKASDALTNAADSFDDAMSEYGEEVKGDLAAQKAGRNSKRTGGSN
jgi:ATP-dependent DNA helicase DinG